MFKRLIKLWHILTLSIITMVVSTFFFALGINPIDVARYLGLKAGQALDVTSSASVPANPFNTVALQLKEKEISLNQREQDLNKMQDDLFIETGSIKQWLMFLAPLVITLFILVLLNFYFDYKERLLLKKIEEDEEKIMEAEKRLEKKIDEKK